MLKRFIPRPETGLYKKLAFWSVTVITGLVCLGIITFAAAIAILSIGLPDVTKLENLNAAQSTEIFDRDGNLLYTIHGEENREYVPLEKISPDLLDATVAIEDDSFWDHSGFDIFALGKGVMYELFGIGSPRGGSTITQQYIKNTFLSAERTYTRKAKELILAIRLERAYTKEEILELYVNRIPYGNNAYGVQKAAEIYFNKDAKDLTLAEATALASLPQAPSRYNPYGNNKYSHLIKEFSEEELVYREIESEFDLEEDEYIRGLIGQHVNLGNDQTVYIAGRSDSVLKRMNELEYVTTEERQQALNELQNLKFNDYVENIKHPHFVMYVKDLLEEKYTKDVVEQGGLKVYTTIDSDIQTHAEKVITDRAQGNIDNYGTYNAAALTVNAKTGEILAMVGSADYYSEPKPEGCKPGVNCKLDPQTNVVVKPRQPGSSFKPFVYAQAFYNNYAPGTVIEDVPTRLGNDQPQNFDGKFQGQISIRRALGQSRNIPAIKAYYLAGEQDAIIDLAAKMGIYSLNKSTSYGYPLAIGSGEVSLMEMVTAYSVFANNGKKPDLTSILKVENANGDILEEWKPKELEEVLDPQIAYLINHILSDQGVAIGPRMFVDGKINAAKTGTSTTENKKTAKGNVRPKDGWILGYTPTIVTGVWIGNSDSSGLGFTADGYNTAAPIFKEIMTKALADLPSEPFPRPEGIKEVAISKGSGKLPGPATPDSMIVTELFPSFSVPEEQEKIFYKVKIDKVSGLLATEYTPADAVEEVVYQNYQPVADLFNWKAELLAYYTGKSPEEFEGGVRPGLPPAEYDNVHTAESSKNTPVINILNPSTSATLKAGENVDITVMVQAPNGVATVEFYVDNDKKYFTSQSPYTGHVKIPNFNDKTTTHLLVAKVVDKLGYSHQSAIQFKLEQSLEPSPASED